MKRILPADAIWTIGLLLTVLVLLGVAAVFAARWSDPARQPLYLSYGTHPYGLKAFARLLEKNGYRVESLKTSFGNMPLDADLLLIFPAAAEMILFDQSRWTEEDVQSLREWVAQGGRLVIFEGDDRLEGLNPNHGRGYKPFAGQPGMKRNVYVGKPLLPSAWTAEVREIEGEDAGYRLKPSARRWVPLVGDGRGGVLVALRWVGRGMVAEFADADLATNEHLRKRENALLLLNVVQGMAPQGSVVYFDDCGQGDCAEPSPEGFWQYVAPAGKIAFAHLMFLALVALYSLGRRFGLPIRPRPRTPALGEYVEALAGLYRGANATHVALEVLFEEKVRELCRRYGLPAGTHTLDLLQMLPPDLPARDIVRRAHDALQKPVLSEAEALQLARELHRV